MTRKEMQANYERVKRMAAQIAEDWKSGEWTIRQLSKREHVGQARIRRILHDYLGVLTCLKIGAEHEKSARSKGRRFHKGHVPWIAGKRIRTSKGVPIGTIRVWRHKLHQPNSHGEPRFVRRRFIKIADDPNGRNNNWTPYCRWVWEVQHDKPVPPGHFVIHKDGDTMNDDPRNLALATLADMGPLATKLCDLDARTWKSWETRIGSKRIAEIREEKKAGFGITAEMEGDVDDDEWGTDWTDEEAA